MNTRDSSVTKLTTYLSVISMLLICLSATRFVQATEVIVDDLDANTRQHQRWHTSSGLNPYAGHSIYSQSRDGMFTWYPVLPEPGAYDVYARWTYHENRSGRVPYYVTESGHKIQVIVNMKDPALAGRWNLLGRFNFPAGSRPEVSVSAENGQANADAVRFVLVDDNIPTPKLKVIEVQHDWGLNLTAGSTLEPYATCPLGTTLTGGGVKQRVFPDPPRSPDAFDYFVGSHGWGNKWIATFYNPSDPVFPLQVKVIALCASIEVN